jgi:plasmid replication initiation protein
MRLATPTRRTTVRIVQLDKSLESLPLFRLSDSADEGVITYAPDPSTRWRVIPLPGDRLPGTFDQDVYVELMRRYAEAGHPEDGVLNFTLHAFLRSLSRRADGRTYEQLRSALGRLERTTLESSGVYYVAGETNPIEGSFTVLTSVTIERRRSTDREQLALFSSLAASEPGDARVVLSPFIRSNIHAGHSVTLSVLQYQSLSNPVARRLYRLLAIARAEERMPWKVELDRLAMQLPLTQRYPSHLQRVLQPAHEMLIAAGLLRDATFRQAGREWIVEYVFPTRNSAIA